MGRLGRLAALIALAACDILWPGTDAAVSVPWSRPRGPAEGWLGRAAISQQTVFTQDGGSLAALDIRTGELRWQRVLRTGVPVNAENVIVEAGLVITAGGDSVRALDAATGAPRWSHAPDANVASCRIAAGNGFVFVGSRAPAITALSLTSGQVTWRQPLGAGWPYEAIVTGVSVSGDTVYATVVQYLNPSGGRRTAHVVALDGATGTELWRYTSPGDTTDPSAPAVTATSLLVGDSYGSSFFALDRFTGQLRWRVPTARAFPGVARPPVVRDGIVFAAAQGGVYAVNELTGARIWSRTDPEMLSGDDVALCGNVLLVQHLLIEALDPATGRSLGTVLRSAGTEVVTSAIASSGSRAFVTGYEGLYGLACR